MTSEVDVTKSAIHEALEVLAHLPSGRRLLETAARDWHVHDESALLAFFEWGDSSRTDAVLTRHFDPATGRETRERQVTIFLKREQTVEELALDIAHELTHALSRPSWDPYDPTLTAAQYIRTAIEGKGGEVEALISECGVEKDLTRRFGSRESRCDRYRVSAQSPVLLERVRRDFYRVGRWRDGLHQRLGAEFESLPLLSRDNPQLFSSTGHAPYPVALLEEFHELNSLACANSRKRLETLEPARSPASDAGRVLRTTREFLAKRCR